MIFHHIQDVLQITEGIQVIREYSGFRVPAVQ